MSNRKQLELLVASYEGLAASQEARADDVLELGMRIGWDDQSMATEANLRRSADVSRMLAHDVHDSITG